MNDSYVEWLVKRKKMASQTLLKILCWVATVIAVLIWMVSANFIVMLVAVGIGVIAYIVSLNADIEYEYLYVDKELSIDKISSKSRRKKCCTLEVERMEIVAPINSVKLDGYKHKNYKVYDYSSRNNEDREIKKFVIYYNDGKKIIIEPNKALIDALQQVAPHKVTMM